MKHRANKGDHSSGLLTYENNHGRELTENTEHGKSCVTVNIHASEYELIRLRHIEQTFREAD